MAELVDSANKKPDSLNLKHRNMTILTHDFFTFTNNDFKNLSNIIFFKFPNLT